MVAGLLLLIATVVAAELTLRKTHQPPVVTVTPTTCETIQLLLQPSRIAHHELIPTSETASGLWPTSIADDFRVNSFGCRGEELNETADPGTYRILFLGDDSICNPWIPEEATLPMRLRQFMQPKTTARLQMINGAVPGDCPLLSWLRYRDRLAALKPDLVLLHLDMSDILDDRNYRRQFAATDEPPMCPHASFGMTSSQPAAFLNLVRRSAIASMMIDVSQNWAENAISEHRSESHDQRFGWIEDQPYEGRLQITHALEPLEALRRDVESHGGRLLVTTTPVLWQVARADAAPELSQRCSIRGVTPYQSRLAFRVIETYCELKQIRFLPVVDAFAEADAPEMFFSREQPVLSRAGLALYAREIGTWLASHPPVRWAKHDSQKVH